MKRRYSFDDAQKGIIGTPVPVDLDDPISKLILQDLLRKDDGAAAQSHLDAGRPIYYWDDRLQSNVRKWPDGRIEQIALDEQGNIIVRA